MLGIKGTAGGGFFDLVFRGPGDASLNTKLVWIIKRPAWPRTTKGCGVKAGFLVDFSPAWAG